MKRDNINTYEDLGNESIRVLNIRQDKSFLIDKEDLNLVKTVSWYFKENGYVYNSSIGYLHAFLLKVHQGDLPADRQIDHINRDKTDNRKSNLRLVSSSLNNRNREFKKKSGLPQGIRKISTEGFNARISWNRKKFGLGTYRTIEEAEHAYRLASLLIAQAELGGDIKDENPELVEKLINILNN